MIKNFKGVYPALLTPFDRNDRISEEQLCRLAEFNLKKGVDGFYVGGSTSEAFLMTLEERKRVLEIVRDCVGDRAVLFAHVGCMATAPALELARFAEKLGYDAVSAVAPFYYKYSFEQIRGYYTALAGAVGLPVLVYSIPAFSGVEFSFENFQALLSDSRFMGVKFTSGDLFLLSRLRTEYPDRLFYNGYDEFLLSGLAAGADGCIGSTCNFMAEKFLGILKAFGKSDIAAAQKLQREVNRIIAVLGRVGVLEGEKEILNQLGFDFGACRAPFGALDAEKKELIRTEILPLL